MSRRSARLFAKRFQELRENAAKADHEPGVAQELPRGAAQAAISKGKDKRLQKGTDSTSAAPSRASVAKMLAQRAAHRRRRQNILLAAAWGKFLTEMAAVSKRVPPEARLDFGAPFRRTLNVAMALYKLFALVGEQKLDEEAKQEALKYGLGTGPAKSNKSKRPWQ